jgi:hypothetical protein
MKVHTCLRYAPRLQGIKKFPVVFNQRGMKGLISHFKCTARMPKHKTANYTGKAAGYTKP